MGPRGPDDETIVATLQRLRLEGRVADAVRVVSELRFDELERLEAVELRALAVLLAEDGQVVPELELRLAHLYDIEARIDERADLLDRLAERARTAGDGRLARAVAAEQARDLARQCELEPALMLARTTLAATPTNEAHTRMRCLTALGLAEAYGSDPGWSHRAADALREGASLAVALGERHSASEAWLWLGYWVLFRTGSMEEAVVLLRRAVESADMGGRRRGIAATFFAEVLIRLGRADEGEALLDEARALGRARHDALTLAYDAWLRAEVAVLRSDRDGVTAHLVEAERHRASWWEHSTGSDFLAAAADMHRRMGDAARCREYLDQADGHVTGLVPSVAFARAAYDASFGDPVAGLAELDELLAGDELFAVDRARGTLLAAVAARRADAPDAASRGAAVARAESLIDEPGLLAIVEAAAVAMLGNASAEDSTRLDVATATYEIRVLDGFEVRASGDLVELPPGMASTLVKLLASSRAATTDVVLDLFWPDDTVEIGRRRLRNLLNRLAACAPGLVVRRDGSLALAATTTIDVDRFVELATVAKAADPAAVGAVVREALQLCGSGLLPHDRYEDWSVRARERIAHTRVDLLEHLAAVSDELGDGSTGLWCRAELVDAEPYEESRYLELARAAAGIGRRELVRATLDRATALATELGVELDSAWAPLRASLHT